jgi:hypothetical protein
VDFEKNSCERADDVRARSPFFGRFTQLVVEDETESRYVATTRSRTEVCRIWPE